MAMIPEASPLPVQLTEQVLLASPAAATPQNRTLETPAPCVRSKRVSAPLAHAVAVPLDTKLLDVAFANESWKTMRSPCATAAGSVIDMLVAALTLLPERTEVRNVTVGSMMLTGREVAVVDAEPQQPLVAAVR